ncbi:MAG: hypothetical protein ACD_78C00116G0002 [uncultured bacterium (gcode 4)]|uniref:Uncharacterized protein n=1 Tax=uncultured bacterium (gcode 4) TaxID=1234023 RepID=K1XZ42_9BACT|nr:MAG: hypothetical protein ACD_78C00116G0002 [uncultured bacterium (gcode 4)]
MIYEVNSEIWKNDNIRIKSEYQSEPYNQYGERGNGTLNAKIEVISDFLGYVCLMNINMSVFVFILFDGRLNVTTEEVRETLTLLFEDELDFLLLRISDIKIHRTRELLSFCHIFEKIRIDTVKITKNPKNANESQK